MNLCGSCKNYFRDERCPFCKSATDSVAATAHAPRYTSVSRAALIAGAAVLGIACGESHHTADDAGMSGTVDTGVAPTDSGAVADSGADDAGSNIPLYGEPPLEDAGPTDDAGAPVAEYGVPPLPDAGPTDDAASPAADYGAPFLPDQKA